MSHSDAGSGPKRVTTRTVLSMKKEGKKIACLTAYDFLTARFLDQAGVDLILVGDSLGMVFQGHETTLSVTLEEMIYHTKPVIRAVDRSMVIVDMPFMSYQTNAEEGFHNAGRVMKETGAGGVKFEGGERIVELVRKTVEAGIPVMGHLGLTPQSIHQFGGYTPRGATAREAKQILRDAKALEHAGVFAIVLEKMPAGLSARVTKSVSVPTIGIGAGLNCDGQILVVSDLLGLYEDFHPRFVRRYARLADDIRSAVGNFVNDVRGKKFPSKEESY